MEHIFTKLVKDFEEGKMSRRQLIQGLMITATAASAAVVGAAAQQAAPEGPGRGSGFTPRGTLAPRMDPLNPPGVTTSLTAVGVSHISFDVKDCAKTAHFYADLFGMRVFQGPNTNEAHCRVGETYLTFRNRPTNTGRVQHIAIAVIPWDNYQDSSIKGSKTAEAELRKRGVPIGTGDPTVNDPEGFPIQIIGPYYQTKN